MREKRQKKRVEASPGLTEESQRILMDTIRIPVWCLTDEQTFGYINQAYAGLIGREAAAVSGRRIDDVLPAEAAEECRRSTARVFKTGRGVHSEVWMRDSAGRHRLLEVSRMPKLRPDGSVEFVICSAQDMTDEWRRKEELIQLTDELSAVFYGATQAMFLMEVAGNDTFRYVRINQTYGEMAGISAEAANGKTPQELLGSERGDRLASYCSRCVRLGEPLAYEERPCRDAEGTIWEFTLTPKSDGSVAYIIGFGKNITDQRLSERCLKLRLDWIHYAEDHDVDDLLQRAIDDICNIVDSPLGFFHFVDADRQTISFQAWSGDAFDERRGAAAVKGRRLSLEESEVWTDCLHRRRPVIRNDCVSLPHRREIPEGRWTLTRLLTVPVMRRGRAVAVLGVGNKDHDYDERDAGTVEYLADVVVEIVERSRMRERLRDREQYLSSIVHVMPDMIMRMGVNGQYLDIIAGEEKKLALPEADLVGKNIADVLPEGEAKKMKKSFARAVATQELQLLEYPLSVPAGELWFEARVVPSGQSEVIALVRDITVRKKTEQDLVHAKNAAEVASQAKSDFLAKMSHELRTPLNAVIGFTRLLSETELTPAQKDFVQNANKAGHNLLGLIEGILDFSRIEAGRLELNPERTDIIALVENSMDIVRYSAERKGLEMLLDRDPEMPRYAVVDDIRLSQILVNLLGNAVKFTDRGEVELKVRFGAGRDGDGQFFFSIRDTGIGVPEEQKDKLFRAFSQGDTSITRKFGGTGLGLIISQSLVQKMGGRIEFESEEGKGSVFRFDITVQAEPMAVPPEEKTGSIHRCLIIDDNKNSRAILKKLMGSRGLECVGCNGAGEALQALQEDGPFDVALVDNQVAGIDGVDIIRRIRDEDPGGSGGLPIILLHTSSSNSHVIQECDRMGVECRLTKPVKSDELFRCLRRLGSPAESLKNRDKTQAEASGATSGEGDGVGVLIAEDDAVNMTLTRKIVEKTLPRAAVFEAANGEEACRLYDEHKPDIVLMDVHMPEMSGLEAARAIRSAETGEETEHVAKIFALTADVTRSEKEKCFESGMDAYLAKPVDMDELERLLTRADVEGRTPSAQQEKRGPSDDALVLDLDAVSGRVGDDELRKKLMKMFLDDTTERIDELHGAVQDGGRGDASAIAHAIKGAALNMGCNALGEAADRLDKAARREGDVDELSGLLAVVSEQFERAQAEMRRVLDG